MNFLVTNSVFDEFNARDTELELQLAEYEEGRKSKVGNVKRPSRKEKLPDFKTRVTLSKIFNFLIEKDETFWKTIQYERPKTRTDFVKTNVENATQDVVLKREPKLGIKHSFNNFDPLLQ